MTLHKISTREQGDTQPMDDSSGELSTQTKSSSKPQNSASYYQSVSHLILPHIKDRPLMTGASLSSQPLSLQKLEGDAIPDYFTTPELVWNEKKEQTFLLCQNENALLHLAGEGTRGFFGWASRFDKPTLPDKMVIDLDPPDVTYFEEVVEVAFLLKGLLEEANMCPYVMSTGSRGLHIVCPLRRNRSFERVMPFLQELAIKARDKKPALITLESKKEKRGEKIFLNLSPNIFGQASIIPYSIRPFDHAPVATPLSWPELESSDMHPQRFNRANIIQRIAKKGDVWENFFRHKRKLMR